MSHEKPTLWIVAGAQWGDEGKGKAVDILAEQADVIYKTNGGKNAGHTVQNDCGTFALHLTPSGIFYPDKLNIVGNGVVYSLAEGIREVEDLQSRGIFTDGLFISSRAHLTFAFHEKEDALQEQFRGSGKIGTTGTGNGPGYSDKANRLGLRAEMLQKPDDLMSELNKSLGIKSKLYFPNQIIPDEFRAEYYEELVKHGARMLGDKVVDIYEFNEEQLRKGATLLIEGSHGTLLDIDGGTYPMVTSSSCTVPGLISAAGLPNMRADRAIAIYKAYQTRVGAGPMPTEILDEIGNKIRKVANEFGTTTGRPRRIGWFDGVAAKHAQRMNGFTESVITRGDVLTGIRDIKIATAYFDGREATTKFPSSAATLECCQPIYQDRGYSWTEDFRGATAWGDLPQEAQQYYIMLAKLTGVRPTYIGTGPKRGDGINLSFDLRETA